MRIRNVLEPLLVEIFLERSADDWPSRLYAAGVPCSLVRNFDEVLTDPQCAVREMFPVLIHPAAGSHRVTGTPVKLSDTPGGPRSPAPLLGEHTRRVLADFLELDDLALQDLFTRKVILGSPLE
jgi:crotonobetainyl-CoA:carnitine CoA-transferase CaiB-like acyl-CoA transferase